MACHPPTSHADRCHFYIIWIIAGKWQEWLCHYVWERTTVVSPSVSRGAAHPPAGTWQIERPLWPDGGEEGKSGWWFRHRGKQNMVKLHVVRLITWSFTDCLFKCLKLLKWNKCFWHGEPSYLSNWLIGRSVERRISRWADSRCNDGLLQRKSESKDDSG